MSLLRRAGRLAWGLLVLEVRLYRALALWILRRRPGSGPGIEQVGYARLVTPVMWLWILASALEVPLVHVLTPWPGVRLFLLVLSLWGLVWMVGLLASLKVYPHLVGDDALRVRYGVMTDVTVPWALVADLRATEREWPSSVRSVQRDGDVLAVAVSGRTNVVATLAEPTTLRAGREEHTVAAVAFWVDEPRELVRRHRSDVRR